MTGSNIVCFDFETGGTSFNKHAPIELAISSFTSTDFKDISNFESYIKPYDGLEVTEEALKINGIKWSEINSGIDIKELVKLTVKEFEKAKNGRNKPILLGQNVSFDIGFLMRAFDYCNVDLSKYLGGDKDHKGNWYPKSIDTLSLGWIRFGHLDIENYKLGTLCAKSNIDLIDGHRAMNDVIATKELFIKWMKSMRCDNNSEGENTVTNFRKTFKFQF